MPVNKVGDKYAVKDKEFDTKDEAEKAYMSYLDDAFGVADTKEKKKPAKKTDPKKA